MSPSRWSELHCGVAFPLWTYSRLRLSTWHPPLLSSRAHAQLVDPTPNATPRPHSVWFKHRAAKFYPPWCHALGANLAAVPVTLLDSFLYSVILYFMVGKMWVSCCGLGVVG